MTPLLILLTFSTSIIFFTPGVTLGILRNFYNITLNGYSQACLDKCRGSAKLT